MTLFKNKRLKTLVLTLPCAMILGGCAIGNWFEDDEDVRLPGERVSVLQLEETLEPDDAVLEAGGLQAPQAWKNEFWPQAGGYPNHAMQNLALSEGVLKKMWSADIGSGSSKEIPLTAQPIIIDGKIYTLDTENRLNAFSISSGKPIWTKNIVNKDEDETLISGGISYAGGLLYATNGSNEVLALNPVDGNAMWRKKLPAPSRAAPTVLENRLFVTTLDNRLLAFDAKTGESLWEYVGIPEASGLIGAASPAANSDIVVPAFSSGELTALRLENGSVAWTDNLTSVKRFGGIEGISDIRALPVLDKGLVFAISFGGRLAAIDERTGTRVWQRDIGGANTPWVAGNHVFVVSSDNHLIALGRDTGIIRWVKKIESKEDDTPTVYAGPILAGGRLFVFGNNGRVYRG